MIEYIVVLLVAMVYAGIRARHDSFIRDGKWKLWATIEGVFIAGAISALLATSPLIGLVLFILFGLSFSLVFDMVVGKLFGGSFFYLGSSKWDVAMSKIFLNGKLLAVSKLAGIIGFSGLYFEMI